MKKIIGFFFASWEEDISTFPVEANVSLENTQTYHA